MDFSRIRKKIAELLGQKYPVTRGRDLSSVNPSMLLHHNRLTISPVFSSVRGHFEYTRVSFSIANSTAIFSFSRFQNMIAAHDLEMSIIGGLMEYEGGGGSKNPAPY